MGKKRFLISFRPSSDVDTLETAWLINIFHFIDLDRQAFVPEISQKNTRKERDIYAHPLVYKNIMRKQQKFLSIS